MNSMILLAAGKGQRVGAAINKMLIKVQGKPIFWHSLQHILTSQLLNEIIVVVQERERPEFESIIRSFNSNILFHIAIGGNTRQASVYNGLKLVSPQTEKIIVHDGARPLVDGKCIDKVLNKISESTPAIVVGIPCIDTIKKISERGIVKETLDRSQLFRAQTPQGFYAPLFRTVSHSVMERKLFTDDVSLFEEQGIPVTTMIGREEYYKITGKEDIDRLKTSLKNEKIDFRIGQGYDIHQLCDARPLILGGVKISDTFGLLGHSDADVLTHAIMDALLGAAGFPDIGHFFPDTDSKFKNISSIKLLEQVMQKIREAGYEIGNIDTTIIAQKPKLAAHIEEIKKVLADVMCIHIESIGIKATTKEKMDAIGAGKAIAVIANALLYRRN